MDIDKRLKAFNAISKVLHDKMELLPGDTSLAITAEEIDNKINMLHVLKRFGFEYKDSMFTKDKRITISLNSTIGEYTVRGKKDYYYKLTLCEDDLGLYNNELFDTFVNEFCILKPINVKVIEYLEDGRCAEDGRSANLFFNHTNAKKAHKLFADKLKEYKNIVKNEKLDFLKKELAILESKGENDE